MNKFFKRLLAYSAAIALALSIGNVNASTFTISSPGSITSLNNPTESELVTIGSTTTELDAEANLTFNGTTLTLTGAQTISTTLLVTGITTHGGNVVSDTDSTDDLGTSSVRWANIFTDSIGDTGQTLNITGSATVTVDLLVDDQLAVGGTSITNSIFAITPGPVARDLLTSVGMGFHIPADAWDVNAAGTDTQAIGALAYFGIPTWTGTGSFITTDAATLYIAGPPVLGSGVTIGTRRFPASLLVDGYSRFNGLLVVGSAIPGPSDAANPSGDFVLQSFNPRLTFHEPGLASNIKKWEIGGDAGLPAFRLIADNNSDGEIFLSVARTTTTVDSVTIDNGTFIVNDATTFTGITTHSGNVISDTDSTDDLGTTGVRWLNLFVDDVTITTSMTNAGTLAVTGTSTLTGITTHGDDVVSDTDSTDDLGTTGVRWATLFVDDITITNDIIIAGDMTVASAGLTFEMLFNSTDGNDSGLFRIAGGGTGNSVRGAFMDINGNERSGSNGGKLILSTGNVSDGEIVFNTGSAVTSARIDNDTGTFKIGNNAVIAGSIFGIEPGGTARDIVTSVGTGLHIEADSWDVNASGSGETVAIGALAYFGIPTWTSVATTFTVSRGATVYIQGAPNDETDSDILITNDHAFWIDDGNFRIDGSRSTASQTNNATGVILEIGTGTVESDNNSGTVAIGAVMSIGITTINNDTATLTLTDATSLYIEGIPICNTNVTCTNTPIALWVDEGAVQFDGTLNVVGAVIVDSGGLTVTAGGLTVSDGASTMTDNAASTTATLALVNATASQTTVLGLSLAMDDGANGVDGDGVRMVFILDDAAQVQTEYASITGRAVDTDQATDDGAIVMSALSAGSNTNVALFGFTTAGVFDLAIGTTITEGASGLGMDISAGGLVIQDGASSFTDNVGAGVGPLTLVNNSASAALVIGLELSSDGAVGANGDALGIEFQMDDESEAQTVMGRIETFIIDGTQGTLESEIRLFALDTSVLTEAASFGWNSAGGFQFVIGTSLSAGVGGLGLNVVSGALVISDGTNTFAHNNGATTAVLDLTNITASTASALVLTVGQDDGADGVDNDFVYMGFNLNMDSGAAGTRFEYARLGAVMIDASGTTEDGAIRGLAVADNSMTQVFEFGFSTAQVFQFAIGSGSPAAIVTLTQTDSTAEATLAADTFSAVSETGVTQTTPFGFATAAQGDAWGVEINDLADDVRDLKSFTNSLVDALEAHGIIL